MLYVILAVVALAGDQWLKVWTVSAFSAPIPPSTCTVDAPVALIPGVVQLTRVHNFGAAWSSFSGMRWLLVGLTSVIVAAVAVLVLKKIVRHPLGRLACTLIIAGGLGNIMDRVRLGYVVDMFHLTFWPSYPVFNVADICVVCGALFGAIYYLWYYEKVDKVR